LHSKTARADLFDKYSMMEVFELPVGSSAMDTLPDGRIVTLVDADVFLEDAPGARTFSNVGTLPLADIASFGAAFVAVSPDGTRIAVGNNGGASFVDFRVGVFDFPSLTGGWIAADHFVAAWVDHQRLLVAVSDFTNGSSVAMLDAGDVDPANWTFTTVITNIGGASGGVALDGSGNLYTANGFASLGPSGTGDIRVFFSSDWMQVLSGGLALDFEAVGVPVVDILSGSPLVFDGEGNLLVGGGDTAPDDDAVAIIRASAVADALAGMGRVDVNDGLKVRRVDPIADNDFNFFSCETNVALGELYVRDFGSGTVYVYRDPAGVPAVGAWGAVCMSLGLMCIGTVVVQRRTDRAGCFSSAGVEVR